MTGIPQGSVRVGSIGLAGDLVVPPAAKGLVLFAHGSGSSRHSPRNQYVASVLHQGGFATLLLDLLTESEEQADNRTLHLRFDIELLAGRLMEATDWLLAQPAVRNLAIGYFGASTGGAAALVAAAQRQPVIRAVVSRGGRPDLAKSQLSNVEAPTLLIVGERDYQVLKLNREALGSLQCDKRLSIVSGATHLFEESGALENVSQLALDWFSKHCGAGWQPGWQHAADW